jgi:flagellar basal body-associated protein FliL
MKRIIDIPGNKLLILYRVIVVVMLLLVVLLIGGSLYGLLRSRDSGPLFRIGGTSRAEQGGGASREGIREDGASKEGESAYSVFSGIGKLRIQNTGKQSGKASETAVIILSISFPYKTDDKPFTEELASHLGEFRSIATNYFANMDRDKLARLDEEQAKAELLRQYNALLRLGRIETLYFGDLMIVD